MSSSISNFKHGGSKGLEELRDHFKSCENLADSDLHDVIGGVNINLVALDTYKKLLSAKAIVFINSEEFSKALGAVVNRVARQFDQLPTNCTEDFCRFLALKVFTSDEKATKISPTPLMDEMWHAAILNTMFYAKLQEALGQVIHHRPEGAGNAESGEREKRLSAMHTLYTAFFNGAPHGGPDDKGPPARTTIKNPRTYFITTLTGKTFPVIVDKAAKVWDIKIAVQNQEGIAPCHQGLIFSGEVWMSDRWPVVEFGVNPGDTITLILTTRGC